MKTSTIPAVLLGLVAGVVADTPMSFDCSDSLQDICSHMCWGAYCTTPLVGPTMHYDTPSDSTERKRRTTAGCLPSPNRCSTKSGYKSGYNCDEYPFASTSEADAGGQTNQCVVSGHNSHQGGIISAYYNSVCGGNACEFTVAFGNADGVQYCDAANDQSVCQNNGQIYENGQEAPNPSKRKRDEENNAELGVKFLTKSGMTLLLPPRFQVGQLTKKAVPLNATAKALADVTGEGAEFVQWGFEDDEIVARL